MIARTEGQPEHEGQRAAWIAALWVCLIYATIPLVRTGQTWYSARFDTIWITVAVIAVLAVALVSTWLWLMRTGRRIRPFELVVPLVVVGIAGWWAWELRGRPEEAIHLLEYGVLLVLIYRALRPTHPDVFILVAAVVLTTVMSAVDETIQWITPRRFWDYRDIGLNSGAAVLAAICVAHLDAGRWRRPPSASIQFSLRVAVTLIVLMTLCLANTPVRVASYASRLPFLNFLEHPDNEMAEYGHLHRVAGIGAFKSRLTLTELIDEDRRRGAEIAPVIDRYSDKDYQSFVDSHQAFQDPLLYEARVHIFSRDFHLRRARERAANPVGRRRHITLACRENLLLERFFATTLHESGSALPPSLAAELESGQNEDQEFFSRTSSHLITWISEAELRLTLLGFAACLVALDIFIGVRQRPRAEASS